MLPVKISPRRIEYVPVWFVVFRLASVSCAIMRISSGNIEKLVEWSDSIVEFSSMISSGTSSIEKVSGMSIIAKIIVIKEICFLLIELHPKTTIQEMIAFDLFNYFYYSYSSLLDYF